VRFYTQQHQYYCGIDLHARKMYVCILNSIGKIILHKNIKKENQKPAPKVGNVRSNGPVD